MPTPTSQTEQKIEGQEKPPADKPIEAGTPTAKFIRSLIAEKPKPSPKPTKVKGDEAGDGDNQGGEKPVAKKKAAPEKAPAQPAPVIDEEKLGASIGRSLAEHTAKTAKQEDEKPAPITDAKEARRIAVLERMEKLNEGLYKGIVGRYKESKAKLKEYADEWEKDNPGEKFDENAEEHEAKLQELEDHYDYDEDDYIEAIADLRGDKKLEQKPSDREAKLEERLSEVERTEKARAAAQETTKVAYEAGNQCWEALGDDFAGVVRKDGTIDHDVLKEINTADPVKHDIAVRAATAAEVGAMKIHTLANGLEKHDPRNPQHAALSNFAYEMEQRMLARDPADQVDDEGRKFCSRQQYDAMPEEQRKRHFVFSPDDLKALWVHDVAKRAKADLAAEDEKFTRRARARGLIADEEKAQAGTEEREVKPSARRKPQSDEDEEAEASDNGKPASPTFSSSPKLAAGRGAGNAGGQTAATRFVNKLLG